MYLNSRFFFVSTDSLRLIVTWDVFECIGADHSGKWLYGLIVTWDVFEWRSMGRIGW